MRKICFFATLFFSFSLMAQTEKEKIQSFLNSHFSELNLTKQDVNEWIVKSKTTSKSTKITTLHIQQKCNGIEIFNALSNVWIKDNEVMHIGNRFVKNAQQKTLEIRKSNFLR